MFSFFENVLIDQSPVKAPSRFAARVRLWTKDSGGKVVPYTASGAGGGTVDPSLATDVANLKTWAGHAQPILEAAEETTQEVDRFRLPVVETETVDTPDCDGKVTLTRQYGVVRVTGNLLMRRAGTGLVKICTLPAGMVGRIWESREARTDSGDYAKLILQPEGSDDVALFIESPVSGWRVTNFALTGLPERE